MIFDVLKRIFTYRFQVRGLFNPFIQMQINSLGDYKGINCIKREVPVIVSLTSYPERFNDLPKTLYSLLNQSLKPDKVILWLDEDLKSLNSIPYEITRFIKNGLDIEFRKDISSYTKAIYALKEYPDTIIVTADDDIYYPEDWLKKLYLSYIANPKDIQAHRVHRAELNTPYKKWKQRINEESARFDNFLTGVGGVLYPPNCFTNEVFREDIFLKYATKADDIWFWINAILSNRKIRVVKNHIKTLICTNIFRQLFLRTLYKENKHGGNDVQLANLMKLYGQNILLKIEKEKV